MGSAGKEKKSFKHFARKHLATTIENRRKGAKAKKEKTERVERRRNRQIRAADREEAEHVQQLQGIQETDPELYAYLEQEDPTLLQFGSFGKDHDGGASDLVDTDNEGSVAETESDNEQEVPSADQTAAAKDGDGRITESEIRKQIQQLRGGTEGGAQAKVDGFIHLIQIYLSAVNEAGYGKKSEKFPQQRRKFESSDTVKWSLNAIVDHFALSTVQILGSSSGNKKGSSSSPLSNKRFRGLFRVFLFAISAVLLGAGGRKGNSNGMQMNPDPLVCHAHLTCLAKYCSIFHVFRGLTKVTLKIALQSLSFLPSEDEDEALEQLHSTEKGKRKRSGAESEADSAEKVRITGFLLLRSITLRSSGTRLLYQSAAFKGVFLALIKFAGPERNHIHHQGILTFLMNCVVELYATDTEAAYQHVFVFLRQLAVFLRSAVLQQSQQNIRAVCNWQYITAFRVWCLVVGRNSQPEALGPLIHPTVQLGFGLLDLFFSPRMVSMQLNLLESLHLLAHSVVANSPVGGGPQPTGGVENTSAIYLPVSPYLLRILTSSSIELSESQSTAVEDASWFKCLRVKKDVLRSAGFRVAVWRAAIKLLVYHLAQNSSSVAFPEAFWMVETTIRQIKRQVRHREVTILLNEVLQAYDSNKLRVQKKRQQFQGMHAEFCPADLPSIKMFEDQLRSEDAVHPNSLLKLAAKLGQTGVQEPTVTVSAQDQVKISGPQAKRVTIESVVESEIKNKKQKKAVKPLK